MKNQDSEHCGASGISPSFMYPGAQAELIAASRKARVSRSLVRALKPITWQFDEQHHAGRAAQEAQLRSGTELKFGEQR